MPRTKTPIRLRTNGHSTEKPPAASVRLNLGCGQTKIEGFTGVDISADCGADVVHDLAVMPWPFAGNSVEETVSSHFLEHLTGAQRLAFMDELYRILVPGGRATFITPYHQNVRATQDPTHQWPPISDNSYLYFHRGWREMNGLGHYPIHCDFDFVPSYVLDSSTGVLQWNEERRQFAMKHYSNIISDLNVVMTKHEPSCTRGLTTNCTCAARERING